MAIKFSAKTQPAAAPVAASPAKAAAKTPAEPAATDLFNAPAEPAKGKPRKKK
ncbi:MAG: hypothetical protein J0I79_10790 [Mesorhizobium sp.]|uniref:hypothetical protein n=1 Tax=Mesorhizobium sp. TaxID=1871066 RepID=UPI001ACC2072|nr:hypothetical protein [Mesorhizobium sp.]MBN9218431.1 hypothetical protein [Mesorhizobium sp.]